MAVSPPSHKGSAPLMDAPRAASVVPNSRAATRDWRKTDAALPFSSAPISCAVCTEKPVARELHSPPTSQVEVLTSPIAADAPAPRLPTIAESIYCMMIELICANIAGMLSRITIKISRPTDKFPVRLCFNKCCCFILNFCAHLPRFLGQIFAQVC